uniref:Uncharacterized protein n=1 Tax=Aegilops tauschii TaxID=37682 RepID=M8CRP5_AEGTA
MATWLFFLLMTLALPDAGNGSTNCDAVLIASLVQEQCNGEPMTGLCYEVLGTIITSSRGKLPCLKMVIDQPELKYSGFTRGLLLDMAKSCTRSRPPRPADITAGSLRPKDRDADVAKVSMRKATGVPRDTESSCHLVLSSCSLRSGCCNTKESVVSITCSIGLQMLQQPLLSVGLPRDTESSCHFLCLLRVVVATFVNLCCR